MFILKFILQWFSFFAVLLPYVLLKEFQRVVPPAAAAVRSGDVDEDNEEVAAPHRPRGRKSSKRARVAAPDEDDRDHDDENDAETEAKSGSEAKGGEQEGTGNVVDYHKRKALRTLFVVLASAVRLIFVRTNYTSTATTIQNLLQNYAVLFSKQHDRSHLVRSHLCCCGC